MEIFFSKIWFWFLGSRILFYFWKRRIFIFFHFLSKLKFFFGDFLLGFLFLQAFVFRKRLWVPKWGTLSFAGKFHAQKARHHFDLLYVEPSPWNHLPPTISILARCLFWECPSWKAFSCLLWERPAPKVTLLFGKRSDIRLICKVTLSSPCLWASFHPYPLFQWYPYSKDILLNLSMKCWNSGFDAQDSRLIIIIVQVGAVKNICSSSGGAQEKERKVEVYYQNWWFSEFQPPLNANELFCTFFFNLTLCMTKLRVMVLCLSSFTDNFIMFITLFQWSWRCITHFTMIWIVPLGECVRFFHDKRLGSHLSLSFLHLVFQITC